VLRNVVTNAFKFTYPKGVIEIAVTQSGKFAVITVEDNGVGISQDNLKRLFKVNESVKTYGTNQESGTGLGLILCKEFIEKNGGTISLVSEVNSGTTVTFTIPLFGQ